MKIKGEFKMNQKLLGICLLLVSITGIAGAKFFNASTAELGQYVDIKCGYGTFCEQSSGKLHINPGRNEINYINGAVTLTSDQCGATLVYGSAAVVTLPEASVSLGCKFTFVVNVVGNCDVNPADASDQILLLTNAAGDALRADAVGESIVLQAVAGNAWAVVGKEQGTWSDVN